MEKMILWSMTRSIKYRWIHLQALYHQPMFILWREGEKFAYQTIPFSQECFIPVICQYFPWAKRPIITRTLHLIWLQNAWSFDFTGCHISLHFIYLLKHGGTSSDICVTRKYTPWKSWRCKWSLIAKWSYCWCIQIFYTSINVQEKRFE